MADENPNPVTGQEIIHKNYTEAEKERMMKDAVTKWVEIGTAAGDTPEAETREFVKESFRCASYAEPKLIMFFQNPLAGAAAIAMMELLQRRDEGKELKAPEPRQTPDKDDAIANDPVAIAQWGPILAGVVEGIAEQMSSYEFPDNPGKRKDRYKLLKDKLLELKEEDWKPYAWDALAHGIYGQHDAAWLGLYDYQHLIKPSDDITRLSGLMKTVRVAGWWWMLNDVAVVTVRPIKLSLDNDHRLHSMDGSALAYPDDIFKLWRINGVAVPAKIAETPADQLDPLYVLGQKNVEIRAAGIRKIGYDRLAHAAGWTKLKQSDDGMYELVDVNGPEGRPWRMLAMINPSTGSRHVEGVPTECDTIEKALAFRNQTTSPPTQLT